MRKYGSRLVLVLLFVVAACGAWRLIPASRKTPLAPEYLTSIIFGTTYPGHKRVVDLQGQYSEEEAVILAGRPEEYLGLAAAHPDKPWYLWQWWLRSVDWVKLLNFRTLQAHVAETDEEQRRITAFRENLPLLAERDPENGFPLYFQAVLAAFDSIEAVRSRDMWDVTGRIVDPEGAARAVEYIARAVRQPHFTMYSGAMAAEWRRILEPPETLEAQLVLDRQLQELQILRLTGYVLPRGLVFHMLVLAEELAGSQVGDGDSAAFSLLWDLQTLGAKIAVDDSDSFTVASGHSVIELVAEKGSGLLQRAGRLQEAERLMARGRSLLKSSLLATLYEDVERHGIEGEPLWNDPVLIEESRRLAALQSDLAAQHPVLLNPWRYADRRSGLLWLSMASLNRSPHTKPPFTLDDFNAPARFEYWGWQKTLWPAGMAVILAALLWHLTFLLAGLVRARPGDRPLASPVPGGSEMAKAVCLFGGVAVTPGLAAVWAGNFLESLYPHYLMWIIFWNIWGVATGGALLAEWMRNRCGDGAEVQPESGIPARRRPGKRGLIALAGSLTAAVVACCAYGNIANIWNESVYTRVDQGFTTSLAWMWRYRYWLLALACLLPTAVYAILSGVRGSVHGAAQRSFPQPSRWLWAAAMAGAVVLWLVSYCIIDWQERVWAGRDTLVIPRAGMLESPVRAGVAESHGQHIRRALSAHE